VPGIGLLAIRAWSKSNDCGYAQYANRPRSIVRFRRSQTEIGGQDCFRLTRSPGLSVSAAVLENQDHPFSFIGLPSKAWSPPQLRRPDVHQQPGELPRMIFVTLGSLDNPEGSEPVLEMFIKRRVDWAEPLNLPEFENMPSQVEAGHR
jgi:hypothetical protein